MKTEEPTAFAIGDWTFRPATNELVRGEDVQRLEFRAAQTLEFLCLKAGDAASRDEILAAVWSGRRLSGHTVAVVIRDLRQALGDDSKNPRYLETVAKRGYRLVHVERLEAAKPRAAPAAAASGAPRGEWRAALVAAAGAAGAAGAILFALSPQSTPAARVIALDNARNATGDARFDAIAATANEFSADFIAAAGDPLLVRNVFNKDPWDPAGFVPRRFGAQARLYHLRMNVVSDGLVPHLSITVADARDWSIVWAAMLAVENGEVSGPLRASIAEMLANIETAD